MKTSTIAAVLITAFALTTFTGCTVHPHDEKAERQTALSAGKIYEKPIEKRPIPPLPINPTPDDLVRYALLTNADVEEKYWQWRVAIEQITIDGTQPTNLAITGATTIDRGNISADRTTLTAGNDPMADIVLPNKLSAAAKQALDNAKAAGLRFHKAQFELRRKVLDAYEDYAANAEIIRLDETNLQLLKTTVTVTDARNRGGFGGQQDILKARNEVDLAQNELASMKSQLPIEQATLNALLNRSPKSEIPVPSSLPRSRTLSMSDEQIFALAAKQNPELSALAMEINSQQEELKLARLQYLPDLSLSGGTDLAGISQTLSAMITVPILRYEAIKADIAQAEANLRAAESAHRQSNFDLAAQLFGDLTTVRDVDRQLDLFQHEILPCAHQAVSLTRASYQTGNAPLTDFLDSQRIVIDLERLRITLLTHRSKKLAEIESIDATQLTTPSM